MANESSDFLSVKNYFDEQVKSCSVEIGTYLGRLLLRTHHEDDTSILASIFSNPIAIKHLRILQPPNGWSNEKYQWTIEDFNDRVQVQKETRANGKSCVLNIILLSSTSGENKDHCIGTTGYVIIDKHLGYLGIITDPNTTRLGYATEALYTAICFGFEKLGLTEIIMQTNELNEEMRGWCENTAGLILNNKKQIQINDITFTECEYLFDLNQWNNSIKNKLEDKMNQIKRNKNKNN